MLEKRYDFNTREKHWQEYWREQEIYKFNPEAKNRYMIDTPPPTISGIIHLGHVFSYTQIDVIARHQRMLGKSVFFPFGYDDNGLPTERYVQREKKVKMAETSRQDFINLCFMIALFLAALLIFINNVLPLIGVNISGALMGALNLIKDIALLLGIAFGAWKFVRYRGKTWVILYWVAIGLYVASAICGLF